MNEINEMLEEFNELSDIIKFHEVVKEDGLYLLYSSLYVVPFETKEHLIKYLKKRIEIFRG